MAYKCWNTWTSSRAGRRTRVPKASDVKVFIDPKSLAYLDGTELDYAREGLNEGFKFRNPNESGDLRLRRERSRL